MTRSSLAAAAMTLALGGGCAHKPSENAADRPAPTEAAAYYPLEPGWKWAYEIDRGGEQILATYAVAERLGDVAIVQAGEEKLAYTLMPDGIVRRRAGGVGDYVLKTPIAANAAWPLADGEARVVGAGQTVTVPAGTFAGCAVVEENRSEPLRVVRTTFAPGIGPIEIEVQQQAPSGGQLVVAMKATLRGVTRPGQDPLGP